MGGLSPKPYGSDSKANKGRAMSKPKSPKSPAYPVKKGVKPKGTRSKA